MPLTKLQKLSRPFSGYKLVWQQHSDRVVGLCSMWVENQHWITTFVTLCNPELRGSRSRTSLFSLTWFLLWKAWRKGLGNVPEYIILPRLSSYLLLSLETRRLFFFSFKLRPKLSVLFLVVGQQTRRDEPYESEHKKRRGLEMDVSPKRP